MNDIQWKFMALPAVTFVSCTVIEQLTSLKFLPSSVLTMWVYFMTPATAVDLITRSL